MKLFYSNDAEGCILEGEQLDTSPIKLGKHEIKVGTCIKYMGDGRKHRSFEVSRDYALEYAGMLRLGKESNRILFSIYNFDYFKENNLYYSFVYVDENLLLQVRGPMGGVRDILPKQVEIVRNPVRPMQAPIQLSLWRTREQKI